MLCPVFTLTHEECDLLSAQSLCDDSTLTDETPSFYFFLLSKIYCTPM